MFASAVHRARALSPGESVAVAACALFVVVMVAALAGRGPGALLYAVVLPLAAWAVASTRERPMTPVESQALGLSGLVAGAVAFAVLADSFALYLALAPIVLVAGVAIVRFPVPSILLTFVFTGVFGTFQAYIGLPSAAFVDLLLACLWGGTIVAWLAGARHHAAWLWPGIVAFAIYIVITGFGVLMADIPRVGLESFRASTWYMAAALLIAFSPLTERQRGLILRGILVVALAVGSYASLRWVIGPSGAEQEFAYLSFNNFLDGELRTIGSFPTAKQLAAWTATVVPFLFAASLGLRGAWRLVAIAAVGACTIGMLAPDVRAAPAAAVPGCALVLVLFAASPAFGVRRIAITLVAAALAVGGAVGGFALTLGDKSDTGNRYEAILNPTSDASYQARLFKWDKALSDIDDHPLGHGMGTAGRSQSFFGRFYNIASFDIDNSYLKVGYEQGTAIMVFFGLSMLLMLLGLSRRAAASRRVAAALPMMGAAGSLLAIAILYFVGTYIEDLNALTGWIIVGLGLAAATWRVAPDEPETA
ncbi:O-antigen ligase family protein [Conexibacter sp. SYSU D00693]|uniref:O-antigen ligase family protein n=1 Tax=Conexibacter sp. SYSU D00693 TaxID=2812560 RepID=UPI00196A5F59|nr:O-antigen ligase family protein [Conexibacter sp. SYSU D00693]